MVDALLNNDESSEEIDKLAFVCSCAIDSVKQGGSVLIPSGRLGIILQLLEQLSMCLESSNCEVPIFMISTVAEEMLAFTNIVPEWLCKQRQENLTAGKALFGHVDLIKRKKLLLFPAVHSADCLRAWQEPCIVFAPHWSLRLGPSAHFLRRWSGDYNSLLILEEGIDSDIALLPFKPMAMKVLQCSFLSGLEIHNIIPLLKLLQPQLVLFPENLSIQLPMSQKSSYSFLYYAENEALCVPILRNNIEVKLETMGLEHKLQPRFMKEVNIPIARLKGELFLEHGEHLLVAMKGSSTTNPSETRLVLHWGSLDPNLLLKALQRKGIDGSLDEERNIIYVIEPSKALVEIHTQRTVITAADESLASLIHEALGSVLDSM